ncbi:sulfatase-like hydrolase/transferase [Pollutibacter soli]|uniref:sulfatase-like hydrolase/transferase n=1 Tax=Pollutibacter soli TaxID=3034157 RepID=UPI003013FE4E
MKSKYRIFCISFFCLQFFLFSGIPLRAQRPNILWISCEDMSPRLAAYGDSTVRTPNIDRLAKEGIVYDRVFTTAGVCAPSRCSIISGVNQITAGGQNMRTLYNTMSEHAGLPKAYAIVPPPEIKAFPEYLRASGYFCTNNSKTDYQFVEPPTVWDESSSSAGWQKRKPGQPFFAVYNFMVTHESQVWERKNHPQHVDPEKVPLPPFYPDTKTIRTDVARFYSNIADLDSLIGELVSKLEKDNLLDSTIIFFWSDHGDGLPFFKREIYDRGIKIPLIIRFPDKRNAGSRNNRLISSIDFAPTVLSLAGIQPKKYMQGSAFLGKYVGREHQYIYAARDRMDSEPERSRAVRDGRYKYIRNYHPELPLYQNVAYRLQQETMKELLAMKEKGTLDSIQIKWFVQTKPKEELYDLSVDPWELDNLASKTSGYPVLARMRKAMDDWLNLAKDQAEIPEKEMIKKMWNGQDSIPVTTDVSFQRDGRKVSLVSTTEGASIGYKIMQANVPEPTSWKVYTTPLVLSSGQKIKAVAQRIGYKKSNETVFE